MADKPTDWDLISSYAGLLGLASITIYVGAHGSLPKPKRKTPPKSLLYREFEDEDEDLPDRLSSSEAWIFPIIGSVVLFGMYLVVKYFGTEWINKILGWYFSLAGIGSMWKSFISIAIFAIGNDQWRQFDLIRLLLLKGPKAHIAFSFRTPSIFLLPLATIPSALYTLTDAGRQSILLSDILSLSFCQTTLSLLKLDTFKTGCILLSGLFVYDIYWVFGTDVMVKVATKLDIPIKLMWPKSMTFSSERGFTMLGLGDVVIPGTFIALALRYDYARSLKSNPNQEQTSFPKPYFHAALLAYVAGLVLTMTVMHVFGKAQPALLYLSPACILSFFLTGLIHGDLQAAWNFADEPQPSRPEPDLQDEGNGRGSASHTKEEEDGEILNRNSPSASDSQAKEVENHVGEGEEGSIEGPEEESGNSAIGGESKPRKRKNKKR